jgi:hypothetical protein
LLQPDRSRRLGASGLKVYLSCCLFTGVFLSNSRTKEHAWFSGIEWQALLEKRVRPPIIPTVLHEGDTSNFELTEGNERCVAFFFFE